MSANNPPPQLYPLYNTTFTLHRLSPLYTSTTLPLNTAILHHHARRFREILVGDTLRGVRINVENDALTTAGALQKVTWRLLPTEESWNVLQDEDEVETGLDETTVMIEQSRGILVTVEYEKSTYTGILLRKDTEEDEDGFQHFPLLLTKMPGSLRETFLSFLTSTFDTRISNLQLSRDAVVDALEKYMQDICISEDGDEMMEYSERSRSIRGIIREAEIFIGFKLPGGSAALKTIEIHLMREDLPRLLARGKQVRSRGNSQLFMEALTTYVKSHLALDLKHEQVRIARIACGAFVLGAEGKVKLSTPVTGDELGSQQVRATRELIDGLVRRAAGGILGDVP